MENSKILAETFSKQREDALNEFINIMEQEIKLPSLGKCYNSGGSFVKIRPMRGVEEDVLTNQKLIKSGKAFDILLQNCITEWNGIDLNDLLYGDMNTIYAAIRTLSFGSEYNVTIGCEECGEKQEENIDLNSFKLKFLELDPIVVGKNIFEWSSKDGFKFKFKFLTNRDQKILQEEEKIRKMQKKSDYESSMTDIICQMVLSITNKTGKEISNRDDIKVLIKQHLDVKLIKEFAEFVNINKPDYDMSYDFKCRSCDAMMDIAIPVTTEFFWPRSRS